jgi:hypothetical protein
MKTKQDVRGLSGQHVHRANHSMSMSNGLLSSEALRHQDNCCGIHGAARARAGVKKATVHLARRLGKEIPDEE